MNHPHIPPPYSEEHRLIRIFASLPRGGGCFGWEISMGSKEKASPEGAWHLPSSLNNCRLLGRAGCAAGTGHGAAGNGRSGLLLPYPCRKKCFNSHQRAMASAEACRDRDQGSAPSTPQLCRTQWALHSRRCCKLPCPQFCHPEHVLHLGSPPQEPQWGPPSPGWKGTGSRMPAWHLSPSKLKRNSECHSGPLVGNLFTLDAAALSFMEMFILNI